MRWCLVFLLAAGCFAPVPPPGAPCTTSRECPAGLTCSQLSLTCEQRAIDAMPPLDAADDGGADDGGGVDGGGVDAPAGFVARINLAGPAHVGSSENPGMWMADVGVGGLCSGSKFTASTGTIGGTADSPLFHEQMFNLSGPLACTVGGVPSGTYRVRLLFAELFRGAAPCTGGTVEPRSFSIDLEGTVVEPDLDVLAVGGCALAGGTGKAFSRMYTIQITDSALDITLVKTGTTDGAILNAIELVQL